MLQKCDANAAHICDYFYCLFNVVDAYRRLTSTRFRIFLKPYTFFTRIGRLSTRNRIVLKPLSRVV